MEHWLKNGPAGTYDNPITECFNRVIVRVAVWLMLIDRDMHAPEPLLSGVMMDYAWTCFTSMKEGIAEVSALISIHSALHVDWNAEWTFHGAHHLDCGMDVPWSTLIESRNSDFLIA